MLGWPGGGSATPAYIYIGFLDFFFLNKICDGSILGRKKNVKVVELSQFESFAG
jgi:hypothetical protein